VLWTAWNSYKLTVVSADIVSSSQRPIRAFADFFSSFFLAHRMASDYSNELRQLAIVECSAALLLAGVTYGCLGTSPHP
jgi:hypothetical protein